MRENLHDTPLCLWLRREWRRLEQRIDTVQVEEDDLPLYVLWTIDTLRDGAVTAELWSDIRHELRRRFLADKFTPSGNDLDTMANIVCALTLHCLGLMLTGSMERRELYTQIVHDLGEHWPQVREVKNSLSTADQSELKTWLTEYYDDDVFYTVDESMEWDEETIDKQQNKNMDRDEILKAIAAGASIDKLIVGDYVQGDKHVYPEATSVTHNHFGSSQQSGVDPNEPLSYYIHDAELRQRVIDTAEQRCTKADNVKKLIYDPLVAEGFDEGMLRSSEFLKELKRHLVQMPNIDVAGLQRAFRENN